MASALLMVPVAPNDHAQPRMPDDRCDQAVADQFAEHF